MFHEITTTNGNEGSSDVAAHNSDTSTAGSGDVGASASLAVTSVVDSSGEACVVSDSDETDVS